MKQRTVLIIGARSDIAMALAHRYAASGHDVQLAARRSNELQIDADNLVVRYSVSASVHELDILHAGSFATFLDGLPILPDTAVCVVGLLGEQHKSEHDLAAASLVMRTNYEGPALLLNMLANRFVERGSGTIIGISSVAGDRGRASNYVYGSAKAGFTAFLSGLRNRLADKGVHVLTVLPGFVRTRMTAGMDLPARLTAEPDAVAKAIFDAARKERDVVYTKPIWRWVMTLIKAVPEPIFKKTKL